MTLFNEAVDKLLLATRYPESTVHIKEAAQGLLAIASHASGAERDAGVAALSKAMDSERVQVSGWLAITAGAIVESGAAHVPLASALIEHLPLACSRATAFGELLLAHAMPEEASSELEDDGEGIWLGEQFLPSRMQETLSMEDPDGADAWAGIPLWTAPACACFVRDMAMRQRARVALQGIERLARLHDDIHCLSVLLGVLDDEPFLVLHPASLRGFRLRVSGVADNFQLHTLLADTLVKSPLSSLIGRLKGSGPGLPGKRPPPEAAAVARGDGPQELGQASHGLWDMYDWHALQSDGTLPKTVPSVNWIWGEGAPADIPLFGKDRVVLLAAPSYGRSWNTARCFPSLRAGVVVEETLSAAAVRELLMKMGQAN
jgi:hypothetical protein